MLRFKREMIILSLILCIIFSVSSISATDDIGDVLTANNDTDDIISIDENEDILTQTDDGSFAALYQKISGTASGATLTLENDYTYSDDDTIDQGIVISKTLTIDGQGHTIDAKGNAIFYISGAEGVTLKNINFINARSTYGAAVGIDADYCSIVNCNFTNNTATEYGGGAIYWMGDYGNIENCNFINNSAIDSPGGAIYYYHNTLATITDSTFTGNSVNAAGGGAIYVMQNCGDLNIDKSVFINNTALNLMGSALQSVSPGRITNSIFLNNKGRNIITGLSSVVLENNWFGNTALDYDAKPNVYAQLTVNNWLYLNMTADDEKGIATYMLNNLYDGSGIGIYENYALPTVTLTAKSNNAVLNRNEVVIDSSGKDELEYHLTSSAGTITVSYEGIELTGDVKDETSFTALKGIIDSASPDSEIELTHNYTYNPDIDSSLTNSIDFSKSLTINGNGYTIDAKNQKRIFYFRDTSYSNNLKLKNINFVNGYATHGAAVYAMGNDIEIISCNFTDNYAYFTSSGTGTGSSLYIAHKKLNVIDSIFKDNYAEKSGSVFINEGQSSVGSNIIGCTFIGNEANQYGDAIYITGGSIAHQDHISECLFINNKGSVTVYGSFSGSTQGTFNLSDSIFINNAKYVIGVGNGQFIADNNWFGNTEDNPDDSPNVSPGVTLNNWYVLKMDIDDENYLATLSLNNLYDGSNIISDDAYSLPEIVFNIDKNNVAVSANTVTVDNSGKADFRYSLTDDHGTITASYEDVIITKDIYDTFEDDGSFAALQYLINHAVDNSVLELTRDYIYSDNDDIIYGIRISGLKNLTIKGNNHIIDAKGKSRVFLMLSDDLTLKDLIIQNGYAYHDNVGQGGAIQLQGANSVIDNCTFINNTIYTDTPNRGAGGAIMWIGEKGTLSNNNFIENHVVRGHTYGGAVMWAGNNGNIVNNSFVNNTHSNLGGALYLEGDNCNITSCNFTNSYAGREAGAIGLHNPNYALISDCIFTNNTAEYAGGAIYYNYYVEGDNIVDIINCTFVENTANGNPQIAEVWGGGAIFGCKNLNLFNSTFIHNNAPYHQAGAVFWYSNPANIEGCIFINNTASSIGTMIIENGYIKNSIILADDSNSVFGYEDADLNNNWWGNTAENYNVKPEACGKYDVNNWYYLDIPVNNPRSLIAISLNNLYNQATGEVSHPQYALPPITFNISSVNLTASVDTVTLSETGTAVFSFSDVDYPAYVTASIGGYEFTKQIILGDFDILQKLVDEAENNGVIELTRNYTYVPGLDSITQGISIDKNITINGNGFTIDAKGNSRIFDIDASNVTLKNINFKNGVATYMGGAISMDEVYVDEFNVINCTFTNNTVVDGSYGYWYGGGAIYLYGIGGTYNIIDSRFIDNSALDGSYGGAIYNYVQNGEFNIDNCTFIGNTAHSAAALMIYSGNTDINVVYSVFINNTADTMANCIYYNNYGSGTAKINNNIFLNNKREVSLWKALGEIDADYNWWGNTYDNHTVNPLLADNLELNNWLYLYSEISSMYADMDDIVTIRYYLEGYNASSGETFDYDNKNLPSFNLTLSSSFGKVNKNTVPIDDEVEYSPSLALLQGNVTAVIENIVYELCFYNRALSNITVNETRTIYYDQIAMLNARLNHAGTLYYESNDTDLLSVSSSGMLTPHGFGTAKITISYDGNYRYSPCNATVIVNIIKIPTHMELLNNSEIAMDVFSSVTFNASDISLTADYNNPNKRDIIYVSSNESVVITYDTDADGNCIFEAVNGGTAYVTAYFYETNKWIPSNVTIKVTVKKLSSPILVNDTFDIDVDQTINLEAALDALYATGDLTYESLNPEIVSVDENGVITGLIGGTADIVIHYAGDGHYEENSTTVTVTVNKLNNRIITDNAVTLEVGNSADLDVSLDYPSDLTFASEDESIVSVSEDGQITAHKGGVTRITITSLETDRYTSDTVSVIVTITRLPYDIGSEHLNLNVNEQYDINDLFTLSGLTDISYSSNDSSIASIDENGIITTNAGGNANITVNFPGNDIYDSFKVNVIVSVSKLPNVITVENDSLTLIIDDEDNLNASLAHDGELIFTSNDTGIVDVDENGNVKAISNGTAKITIIYSGSEIYQDSTYEVIVKVNKIPSQISAENSIISLNVGDEFDIAASLNHEGELTYEINDTGIVSVENGVISALANGSAKITVIFAENDRYEGATLDIIVVVSKIQSTITVNETVKMAPTDSVDIGAVLNHEGELTYTSNDTTVASVDENGIITALKEGVCEITVDYAGNSKYLPASETVRIVIEKIKTEIDVDEAIELLVNESANINADLLPDGGALTYEIENTSVISISDDGIISPLAGGKTKVIIKFAGDEKYLSSNATVTVTIKKKDIAVNVDKDIYLDVGEEFDLASCISIDEPGEYDIRYVSNDYKIASVDDKGIITAVSGKGLGNTIVTVLFKETDRYNSKIATVTVHVNKLSSQITVENNLVSIIIDGTVNLNALLNHEGNLTYVSYNSSVASVDSNGNVIGVSNGTTYITVRFDGDDKYLPANRVIVSVYVNKIPTEISVNETIEMDVNDQLDIQAAINPQDADDLIYTSNDTSIVTVDEYGTITAIKGGTAKITIRHDEDDRYLASENTVIIKVNKLSGEINVNETFEIVVDDELNLDASTNTDATLTYETSNSDIVTVDENGNIKAISAGTATITIVSPESDKYLENSVTVSITVNIRKAETEINVGSEVTLYVDGEVNLGAVLTLNAGTLTYTSNDTSVVSVDDLGYVRAIGQGTAKIYIEYGGNYAYLPSNATVIVTVNKIPTEISIQDIILNVGDMVDLTEYLTPYNAGILTCEINDTDVVYELDEILTAICGGKAQVTVKFAENEKYLGSSKTITLTVIRYDTNIDVETNNIELNVGEESSISATLTPNMGKLIYVSDNPDVVSVDEDGNVKALSEGSAKITVSFDQTAEYEGSAVTVDVNVKKADTKIDVNSDVSLDVGDSANLGASVTPAGKLTYESSNPDVVSVDENGNVKALSQGSAVITVSTPETDSQKEASKTVNVDVSKKSLSPSQTVDVSVAIDTGVVTYTVTLPKDAKGDAKITIGGKTYSAPVSDGFAKIQVSDLASGNYKATVSYSGDNKYDGIDQVVDVHVPNIKIDKNKNINMFYYDGTQYIAHLTSDTKALEGKTITFKLDGKTYNVKTDKYGYAYLKITLVPGTYDVSAEYLHVKVANKITVKHVINAKNVNAKKSANLKIKVTLKNKKAISGKKLTLKFRGKTYSAKTNSKGVAEFTIKKSVLSKLTAGKKYTYTVTYLKSKVSKKVTVKK